MEFSGTGRAFDYDIVGREVPATDVTPIAADAHPEVCISPPHLVEVLGSA